MTMNLDAIRERLQSRLAVLLQRAGAIETDLRATHDDDWTERATERENDTVLERLDDFTRREVQQIRRAVHRIDTGQYGLCVVCGRAIDPARLEAVPTAVNCVGCGVRPSA
jgi:RNA polymerase-binding protein DksA